MSDQVVGSKKYISARSLFLLSSSALGIALASPAAASDCRTIPAPNPGDTVICTIPSNPPAFYDDPVQFGGTDDVTIILDANTDIDLNATTPGNTSALLNSGIDPTVINNGTISILAPTTTGVRGVHAEIGTTSTFGLARNTGSITINADNATAVQAGTANSGITGLSSIEARNDGGTIALDSGGLASRMNGVLAFGNADFVGAANQGNIFIRTGTSDAVEAINSSGTGEADAFNAASGVIDFGAIDGRVLRAQAAGDAFGTNNGSIIVRSTANNVTAISVTADGLASGVNDGRIEFQSNQTGGSRIGINARGQASTIVRNTADGEILGTGSAAMTGISAFSDQLIQVVNEGVIDLDGPNSTGVLINSTNGNGNVAVFQNTGTIEVAGAPGSLGRGALISLQGTGLVIENGGLIQAGGAGDDGEGLVISQSSNGLSNLAGSLLNANGGVIRGDFALSITSSVDNFVVQNEGLIESLGTDPTDFALTLRASNGFELTNTGDINGAVNVFDSTNTSRFANSGNISGDVNFDDMAANIELINSGTIIGDVVLASNYTGLLEVTHSGTLDGDLLGNAVSSIELTTSGTITGNVSLGSLNDLVIVNDGAVFQGSLDGGAGSDELIFDVTNLTTSGAISGFEDVQVAAGAVVFDEVTLNPNLASATLTVLSGTSLEVSSGQSAIGGPILVSGDLNVSGDGELVASNGLEVLSGGEFANAGSVTGDVLAGGLSTNSGLITGTVSVDGATFQNSGTLDGSVDSSAALAGFTLENEGVVTGDVIGSAFDDELILSDGSDIRGSIDTAGGLDRIDITATTLTLSGQIDNVEAINILGGDVTLDGFQHSISSGAATLFVDQGTGLIVEGAGGQFGGSLEVDGDLLIALDSSLTLSGDLIVMDGASAVFGLDETSNGSVTAANADFQSGSTIVIDVATTATNLTAGGEFDIVTVGGTITDAADANLTDNSALFDFSREVVSTSTGEALRVTIARSIQITDLVDPTTNPGQVASGLDALIDDLGTAGVALSTALGQLATLDELADAVDQISPGDAGAPVIAGFELADLVRLSLRQRTKSDLDNSVSLWVSGAIGTRELDAAEDLDALDLDTSNFAFGADIVLTPGLQVGAGYSFASGDYTETGDGIARSSDFDGGMLFGYADFALGKRGHLSIVAGTGSLEIESARSIGILNQTALAEFDTDVTYLRGEAGFDIPVGSEWALTPVVAANLIWSTVDSYSETGSDAAIRFDEFSADRHTLQAGMEFGRLPEGEITSGFFPYIYANAFTQIGGDQDSVAAQFVGGGDAFSLRLNEIASTGAHLGGGFELRISSLLRLDASVEQEFVADGNAFRAAASVSLSF